MTAQIQESFSWLSPEFTVKPTDKNTVKIKGIAVRAGDTSRNQRLYTNETLEKGASSFIEEPITINHADWHDKNNHVGRVNWMAYENGCMEYVGEVWNRNAVEELRLYAKEPTKSKIRGVSVEASYLYNECPVCKQRFIQEAAFEKHMSEIEFKPMKAAPTQLKGRALSLVMAPHVPGIADSTLTVMETVNGLSQLLESIVTTVKAEEDYMSKTTVGFTPRHSIAVGPTAHLAESEAPEKPSPPAQPAEPEPKKCLTCGQTLNKDGECTNKECKECHTTKEATLPPAKEPPKFEPLSIKVTAKEATTEKVIREALKLTPLKETVFSTPNFTAEAVESGQAAQTIKEQKELTEAFREICGRINTISEFLAQPLVVTTTDTAQSQIASLTESTQTAINSLQTAIKAIPIYDDKPLRAEFSEKINAVPIYNDAPIKESIAQIKPYDDSALKETLKTLTETVNTQATKLTTTETALKQLQESSDRTLKETTAEATKQKETITQLTETVAAQKRDFDALLGVADKNTGELRKQLEETKKDLESQKTLRETQEKELKTLRETAEAAKTLAENERDHRTSNFKSHNPKLKEPRNDPVTEDPLKKEKN